VCDFLQIIIICRTSVAKSPRGGEDTTHGQRLMLGFLASASGYSPIVRARPLMLPATAAFYTSVVHGEELTPAQRLLLERRSLNEMKERFRVAGRYPPPVFDRRLPSCLLLAREAGEDGPILGCAGLELALVDAEKRIVLRRSRSEALLRERLGEGGTAAAAEAGGGASNSPASGRRFHRPLLPGELGEEAAALQLQASYTYHGCALYGCAYYGGTHYGSAYCGRCAAAAPQLQARPGDSLTDSTLLVHLPARTRSAPRSSCTAGGARA
jgi:hypothetical protein